MDIIAKLAEELQIKKGQAEAAVKLIDEGNTIPFIARYRKEATGALSDEILRNLFDRLTYLRNLEDKKQTVLASIEEQGKLTEELKAQILAAETQVAVDLILCQQGAHTGGDAHPVFSDDGYNSSHKNILTFSIAVFALFFILSHA